MFYANAVTLLFLSYEHVCLEMGGEIFLFLVFFFFFFCSNRSGKYNKREKNLKTQPKICGRQNEQRDWEGTNGGKKTVEQPTDPETCRWTTQSAKLSDRVKGFMRRNKNNDHWGEGKKNKNKKLINRKHRGNH